MAGATTGGVSVVLRLEGAAVLVAAVVAYTKFGLGWGTFALFFLAPDISFLAYLAGPRIGAAAYDIAHTYILAISCALAGFLLPSPILRCAGLIWCAHIGFDRALGYGLKYAEGFGFTHLGRVGRNLTAAPEPGPGREAR